MIKLFIYVSVYFFHLLFFQLRYINLIYTLGSDNKTIKEEKIKLLKIENEWRMKFSFILKHKLWIFL